jgi:hypothetical protein
LKIANSFSVAAPPDRVFAYMLDINKVVGCVPGAELTEVVDAQTFKGKLTLKVGAVKAAFQGTARIVDTQEEDNRAVVTVKADGREIGGQGTARATLLLSVEGTPSGGTQVGINADFSVSGKFAQFGSRVMEDISQGLVNQMGACIGAALR